MSNQLTKLQKKLEVIKGLRLMDDMFMTSAFEDKECAELVFQVISMTEI